MTLLTAYGRYEAVDCRNRGEGGNAGFITQTTSAPLSVPYTCGTMATAFEIIFARERGARHDKLSPNMLETTCFPQAHPGKRKGRSGYEPMVDDYRGGGVEIEKVAPAGDPPPSPVTGVPGRKTSVSLKPESSRRWPSWNCMCA